MADEDLRCPDRCGAGYVVRTDGPHECAECGQPMVKADQSGLDDYGD